MHIGQMTVGEDQVVAMLTPTSWSWYCLRSWGSLLKNCFLPLKRQIQQFPSNQTSCLFVWQNLGHETLASWHVSQYPAKPNMTCQMSSGKAIWACCVYIVALTGLTWSDFWSLSAELVPVLHLSLIIFDTVLIAIGFLYADLRLRSTTPIWP